VCSSELMLLTFGNGNRKRPVLHRKN
jgi:hypothetical protein